VTVLCGGGPSAAKPGTPAAMFLVGEIATQLAISRLGLAPTWASLIGFAAGQTITADSLCAGDPPDFPTITPDDALALVTFDPIGSFQALSKLADILLRAAWFEFCQCSSVTTPGPGSAPAYPTGVTVVNPTQPIPGTPCATQTQTSGMGAGAGFSWFGPITLPSGASVMQFDCDYTKNSFSPDRNSNIVWDISYTNSAGSIILGGDNFFTYSVANDDLQTFTGPIPAGAVRFNVGVNPGGSGWSGGCVTHFREYCNGASPTGSGCDDSSIAAILQLLNYVRSQVDLIQRQNVPFAYLSSAAHTGLTGEGEISIQGLLGVRVLLTSLGGGVGAEAGDPDVLFDAGWINWGNASGFSNRVFIGCSPMVSLPRSAGQYTRLGYSLGVGVTATITELVRES
jgi:hypothetical protein